jgi:hypothetical protein
MAQPLNNNDVGHFGSDMFSNAIRVTETRALQVDKLITTPSKIMDQDVEFDVSVCKGEKTVIFSYH